LPSRVGPHEPASRFIELLRRIRPTRVRLMLDVSMLHARWALPLGFSPATRGTRAERCRRHRSLHRAAYPQGPGNREAVAGGPRERPETERGRHAISELPQLSPHPLCVLGVGTDQRLSALRRSPRGSRSFVPPGPQGSAIHPAFTQTSTLAWAYREAMTEHPRRPSGRGLTRVESVR
jgi:hypothetical protein